MQASAVPESARTRAATPQDAPCPLCGTAVRPDDVRWRKDGFDIMRCPGCSLVFRATLPTRDEVEAIYGREYFERAENDSSGQGYLDYLQDADEHRLNARRRLDAIERLAPGRGRLFDVGAAAGFFADEARKRGWSVQGVDVSPFMTGYARDELGVDMSTGLFQAVEDLDRYDLITMWDYIEHSIDPVGDVRRAAGALEPGGLLVLSTGDIDTLTAKLSGSRWHLLTPNHHNFYFSTATLRRLLGDAGLVVVSARHSASYFSIRYLVHKLRTMLPWSSLLDRVADRTAASPLGERAVPVTLGDVVTIVARKPAL
jgi:2-polyprenyl-3-methyl-5-hydroxy-6-metoxy-1,4-benzoquinol methylase